MCIADIACCGMPACANGKKHAKRDWSTTPIAYMIDRAGGARFGALSALHGFDVFIALISKGGVGRVASHEAGRDAP